MDLGVGGSTVWACIELATASGSLVRVRRSVNPCPPATSTRHLADRSRHCEWLSMAMVDCICTRIHHVVQENHHAKLRRCIRQGHELGVSKTLLVLIISKHLFVFTIFPRKYWLIQPRASF